LFKRKLVELAPQHWLRRNHVEIITTSGVRSALSADQRLRAAVAPPARASRRAAAWWSSRSELFGGLLDLVHGPGRVGSDGARRASQSFVRGRQLVDHRQRLVLKQIETNPTPPIARVSASAAPAARAPHSLQPVHEGIERNKTAAAPARTARTPLHLLQSEHGHASGEMTISAAFLAGIGGRTRTVARWLDMTRKQAACAANLYASWTPDEGA